MPPSMDRAGWFTCPQPDPQARLRLVCLPYAGGGSLIYRRWTEFLPPGVELCAVELPGRGLRMREAPQHDVGELVDSLGRALEPLLDRPYVLFGHSMGGLLCFELARWLRRHSVPAPLHLFASAAGPPDGPRPRRMLHTLPDMELVEKIRSMNGTPAAVLNDRELLAIVLPILRADFGLIERYTFAPDTPLDCPVTVFVGLRDRLVPAACVATWKRHTRRACRVVHVPGDHFFIHQPVFHWLLAQELAAVGTSVPAFPCGIGGDVPGFRAAEDSQ